MTFSLTTRFKRQSLALWKFLLSFRTRDWCLEDYPIHLVQQSDGPPISGVTEVPAFRADIVNWHCICGLGDTPSAALAHLQDVFRDRKGNGKPLPRPGRVFPAEVSFASSERVDAHPNLKEQFIHEVLGYEWAFISDDSTLRDFSTNDDPKPYFEKIRTVFGVDVSGADSDNLADILDILAIKIVEARK